jgi:segregation and condensation protein B
MFGQSRSPRFSRNSWRIASRLPLGLINDWPEGRRSVWNLCDRPWTRVGRPESGLNDQENIAGFGSESSGSPVLGVIADDPENSVQRRRRAEAVLLFTRDPLPLRKLAQLAGLADATEARTLLRQLNELYDRTGSALRVEEIAGGYQLLTRPGLAPWLRRFASAPPSVRLSSPAMETLAVVAYRQPVLRANIEAIRGVACGEILRQLMQRDLVRICGRSEELGRPYLYGTTKHFLQTFGLKDVSTLPIMSGAGVEDDSEDTCANLVDQDQGLPAASPIEANQSDNS